MKINDLHHIQSKQPGLKSRSDTTDSKTDFNTILKDTVAKTDGTGSAAKTQAVVHPFATVPINPVSLPTTEQTAPLVDRIDRLVDLLDEYRQKLGDPGTTLKSIQPLMDDIAATKDRLVPEISGLEDENPLKEVLNRSLVTATTEIMRFNRGDYV